MLAGRINREDFNPISEASAELISAKARCSSIPSPISTIHSPIRYPSFLMKNLALALSLVAATAQAQHVTNPHASLIDVPARQATLSATKEPTLRAAIKSLHSCTATTPIAPPPGRMAIPHHYLTGSNGPTNPEERAATRVYEAFESRVAAGANQYVATASHAESACALAQLDAWAQAGALLDYDRKESPQSWYQVEWTLSSIGISDSILVNDATLDAAQQKRVTAWLDKAAHKCLSFEKPGEPGNNHHYWRALAAISIGVTASDDKLFRFAIDTYKEAIGQIDQRGAFPLEMARHENAIHYQAFALQPLVGVAQFASRQGIDLYAYQANGHTLRDAIVFLGRAIDDPSLVKPYTNDAQKAGFGGGDFAPYVFYTAQFGTEGLPPSIVKGIQGQTNDTRLGGSAAILAGK
jgi:poly(beta-D-mannuronate) lyase